MKKFFILFTVLGCSLNAHTFSYLWEADPCDLYVRSLALEARLDNIYDMIDIIRTDPKQMDDLLFTMEESILRCKEILGIYSFKE